jgi:hypothetical protein
MLFFPPPLFLKSMVLTNCTDWADRKKEKKQKNTPALESTAGPIYFPAPILKKSSL